MENYNRTRLRSINQTAANAYLTAAGTVGSTGGYARTFSFRGRSRLSPATWLENNNLQQIDTLDPAIGFTGGGTVNSAYGSNGDWLSLDGNLMPASEIVFFIGSNKKYATATSNFGFGAGVEFTAPTGSAGVTSVIMCTPYGYTIENAFEYSNIAP